MLSPKQPIASKDIWKALRGMYGSEPFVRLVKYQKGPYQLPDPKSPSEQTTVTSGSKSTSTQTDLIMFSALDNMCKGASGQGVQCMNLIMGIDETTGLVSTGFHPM